MSRCAAADIGRPSRAHSCREPRCPRFELPAPLLRNRSSTKPFQISLTGRVHDELPGVQGRHWRRPHASGGEVRAQSVLSKPCLISAAASLRALSRAPSQHPTLEVSLRVRPIRTDSSVSLPRDLQTTYTSARHHGDIRQIPVIKAFHQSPSIRGS